MLRTDGWLGIGTYNDTPGSPSLLAQLDQASDLLGPRGWVVIFFTPLLGPGQHPDTQQMNDRLNAAYKRDLRVILRLGWSGAMRDMADTDTNRTRYTTAAQILSAVVSRLSLPPPSLGPLLVHAGNELNACNEWRCSNTTGAVLSLTERAAEVAGFMHDSLTALSALEAAHNGSLSVAHASIASWQHDGCQCVSNEPVGPGRPGTYFLAQLLSRQPSLYQSAQWLSSHSYPYSNANYSSAPTSKAMRGLTYYRSELQLIGSSLPVAITETSWARGAVSNPVSAADQAAWLSRAAEEIWAPDRAVLTVCPFLLVGRFWEAKGWPFVTCPPGNASAPCTSSHEKMPVYDAWQRVARNPRLVERR